MEYPIESLDTHGWHKIEEGNQKGGEMNYSHTGAMLTGTSEGKTQTFRDNVLRLSSFSG